MSNRVIKTLAAIEGYAMLSSIAMGIIQMLCLMYRGEDSGIGFPLSADILPPAHVGSEHDGVPETEFVSFYGSTGRIGHN